MDALRRKRGATVFPFLQRSPQHRNLLITFVEIPTAIALIRVCFRKHWLRFHFSVLCLVHLKSSNISFRLVVSMPAAVPQKSSLSPPVTSLVLKHFAQCIIVSLCSQKPKHSQWVPSSTTKEPSTLFASESHQPVGLQ